MFIILNTIGSQLKCQSNTTSEVSVLVPVYFQNFSLLFSNSKNKANIEIIEKQRMIRYLATVDLASKKQMACVNWLFP